MHTAKLFMNGQSQAVRLPKIFRFEHVREVFIKKEGDRLILSPTSAFSAKKLVAALKQFDQRKLFPERDQQGQQTREEW